MGQQASIQQTFIPTSIQTEPSQWDRRIRGGCDISEIMQQIRDEFGTQGLQDVKNKIYYLSAHGSYGRKVGMISIPSNLTIIHLTAFSSSISNVLAQDFSQLPIEMKIAMLRHPNCARNILQDLEEAMGVRYGEKFREDKSWKDADQLSLVMYQNEAPDMFLDFCGEISSPEEIKSSGVSTFFKTGLTHDDSTPSQIMEVEQNIGDISASDPRAERILKLLLYENKEDQPLIDFFLDRLYSGSYSTIGHVMQVYLSELESNGLLPTEGYLFITACRYCKHPSSKVSVGGEHGQTVYEKDLQALSTEPLLDVALENSCSQLNCSQRILSLDPGSEPQDENTVCKTSGYGCSVCSDGTCVSCIDSNSVVVLPDGKMSSHCSMCFTMEEILDLCWGEKIYRELQLNPHDNVLTIPNLPNILLPNPIYPKDCKIDSRILKFCLALRGNPNQVIFNEIYNDNQLIEVLYILLCFKYIDFSNESYLNNFGSEVWKIRFNENFLRNNTIAAQFFQIKEEFLNTANITSFLELSEQYYNYMAINETKQVYRKKKREKKMDSHPYNTRSRGRVK